MRTLLGSLFQNVEPRLLDFPDLFLYNLVALQIALERAERVNDFETPFVMRLASKRV